MTDAAQRELLLPPFTAFNFRVEIYVPGLQAAAGSGSGDNERRPLCSAAFADCDGLEMTMEPKTIREGGNNYQPKHLVGPVSYGQLALKRGMSATFDLWHWFDTLLQRDKSGLRGEGLVVMLAGDGVTEQLRFALSGCLPVKLKAPSLSAKEGLIAIEEMQIAYERLSIEQPSAE